MTNVQNPNYEKFLKNNIIDCIDIEQIGEVLKNIKSKYVKEARALIIIMYYSGARPNEILNIKGKDISLKGHKIIINLQGSKNGLPRPFIISTRKKFIMEFWQYTTACYPELYLFYHFRDNYVHLKENRKGEVVKYIEISNKLRYHFKKWFACVIKDSIPPYFLRHNRFTKMMMKGAKIENVRLLKGAKTVQSVYPYLHYSSDMAKQTERFID